MSRFVGAFASRRIGSIGSRRYQLTAVASSLVDLVGSAGGWMCDKARAGWDVKVVLTDHHDTRPLAILGASTLDVDAELSDVVKMASHGGALAIGACVLAADERIRARACSESESGA